MRTFHVLLFVLISYLASSAGVEAVQIPDQVCTTLSGIVTAPGGQTIPNVQVLEVNSHWKTTLRSTTTDAFGHWSLAPVPKRKVYYLRFVGPIGFNQVWIRVMIDSHNGKQLQVALPVST